MKTSSSSNRKFIYKYNTLYCIFIIFFLTVAAGCSKHTTRPPDIRQMDMINPEAILNKEKKVSNLGPPVFSEKLEPVTEIFVSKTKLFSFVFKGAPLKEVLKILMDDSEYNLSIESGINMELQLTVNLKHATFKEALNMIVRESANLSWVIKNNTLYIKQFEERIYQFDYIDISGETIIKAGGDMLGSSAEGSGVSGQFEINTTRTAKNTDIWSAVNDALINMISPQGIFKINKLNFVIIC